MRSNADLSGFTRVLPYSSEIFGVYQPLLGWRSDRARERLIRGIRAEQKPLLDDLRAKFRPQYEMEFSSDRLLTGVSWIEPGITSRVPLQDTVLMREIQKALPPRNRLQPSVWDDVLSKSKVNDLLNGVVRNQYLAWHQENREVIAEELDQSTAAAELLEQHLRRESTTAGLLLRMKAEGLHDRLQDMFYGPVPPSMTELLREVSLEDPFDIIDPRQDLDRVGLSPIGVAHLFRQYFFEFDTFLGQAVGHVWISPGATVELLEVSTRRTFTERVSEQVLESVLKTEFSSTDQDEISDAVKVDNRSESKFGANVKGDQKWIWGSAAQSASFDLSNTQSTAREYIHKHMRQQSEKLSTEIRKNFKSTFRVVTESTDTSSKRYVLTNPSSDKLLNYELRRKMRQVGVQVQDIGTYLCWQTHVDEPGKRLGIAELVHIAKPPGSELQAPEELARPQPIPQDVTIDIPFEQTSSSAGDLDEGYRDGREIDSDFNEGALETIRADFPQKVIPPQPGYYLDPSVRFDKGGADVELSVRDLVQPDEKSNEPITEVRFTAHLDYVNFKGHSPIKVTAKLVWLPRTALIKQVEDANQARAKEYKAKEAEQYRREFVSAARERIKLASTVRPRSYDDLREEERIVVYRALIQEMLTKGIRFRSEATRHAASELLDSIFDVDKMLYFVAPEWWKPRSHYSQLLGEPVAPPPQAGPPSPTGRPVKAIGKRRPPTTVLPRESSTSWGGAGEQREDNYYITEDSNPARLGSSLGWLLQLDGDDLRNAYLNAPWVKAVIPIRPGKHRAALNWLQQVEGMNGIGPDDMYLGSEPTLRGKTMLEALEVLAEQVDAKHAESLKVGQFPPEEQDDDNKVSATPVDKVYEHGFYPLQGGFRATPGKSDPQSPEGHFEVFDQWIEVLPTDQIVAVEVAYDPRTGRQVERK